ncbi:hypothetical protein BS78_03G055000 [Paspalum vaginatum]|nr:hypothetical protein BS78_03G055000 [Paspalum vaginatum]
MPSKWQVWGQPNGSLVWVPASDAPPTRPPPPPPRPAGASSCPLDRAPNPPLPADAPIGGPDGRRMPSMADLLLEALDKLIEGDGMDSGGLFSTGSGRPVALSEKAVRRARALVGEEATNNSNKRKQAFNNGARPECEQTKLDVPLGGGERKYHIFPVFQTGSGNVELKNIENAPGGRQPMFHTGTGRSVLVRENSNDKARAVLAGEMITNEGGMDGMEQFPMFQTGSGRAVSISMASVKKAKVVLEESNINTGNAEGPGRPNQSLVFQTGSRRSVLISERSIERSKAVLMDEGPESIRQQDTGCQLPIFQTGLGRPVAVKQSSIKKARGVLEDGDVKRSGNGDTNVCASPFQFETPTSVLMSSNLIINDRTVTPEGNASVRAEKCYKVDGHLPLFQTGSGRPVTVSKGSIKRATAVLEPRKIAKEMEDEAHLNDGCASATSIFKTRLGRNLANENSRGKAQVVLEAVNRGCGSSLWTFQTGSGKSVLVSESSTRKARSVLEEEDDVNRENCKLVQMDKKFPVFASPLKTSCSRTVNISSAGVSRAATLLGLEESTLSTQFFGHVGDKLGTKITVKRENPEHRLDVASALAISGGPHKGFCPTENENTILMDKHHQFGLSKSATSDGVEHSMRFSTACGRSVASAKEKLPNSTISPEGGEFTSSHRTRVIGHAVPDTPVTKGNANKFHMERDYHPINEIPKVPKPPSRCLCEVNNARDTEDKTQRHHMPTGLLVDITNYMATCSGNTDHIANGKRIIGGRNSISPFKRPRFVRKFKS